MKLRWKYILGCAVLFESGIVYSTCVLWWKLLFIPIYFLGCYLVDGYIKRAISEYQIAFNRYEEHKKVREAYCKEQLFPIWEKAAKDLEDRKPMDTPL